LSGILPQVFAPGEKIRPAPSAAAKKTPSGYPYPRPASFDQLHQLHRFLPGEHPPHAVAVRKNIPSGLLVPVRRSSPNPLEPRGKVLTNKDAATTA